MIRPPPRPTLFPYTTLFRSLTAMVPAAILILTAATLFAKNLCRPILAPGMTDQQVARLAKITVLVITAAALCSAIYSSATRSEEHTSELQSHLNLVCRLLLE